MSDFLTVIVGIMRYLYRVALFVQLLAWDLALAVA